MKYIEVYNDAACKNLFGAFPCQTLDYGGISGTARGVNMGGHLYSCLGNINGNLFSFTSPDTEGLAPAFLSTNNRFPNGKTFYTKSGFNFTIKETSTNYQDCTVTNLKYNTTQVAGNLGTQVQPNKTCALYFVEVHAFDTTYYGLTAFQRSDNTSSLFAAFLTTEDFWATSFRLSFNYGTKPNEGGQATGKIDHSKVGRSTVSPSTFPTGAQGFHAYIITPTGLDELQGSLWGEGSTLAKSLWQKFLNSKHNPIHCIVGCYRLPTRFMPLRLQSSGVHLGGVNIPISSGNCYTTQLRIATLNPISTNVVDAPFDSWLDYYGVSVKISIPFCGTITAPAEKVFGKSVSVSYRVDQANGNFAALVYTGDYDYILGELTGNVAYNIPVCGGDDGTLARLGAIASNALSLADSFVTGAQQAFSGGASEKAGFALSTVGKLRNVSDIVAPPFNTQVANRNMAGSVAACTNGIFYVEYLYANVAYAGYKEGNSQSDYAQAVGYPSYAGGTVGSFRGGYGEFYVIPNGWDVSGATAQEKNEIINLLETGVFVNGSQS